MSAPHTQSKLISQGPLVFYPHIYPNEHDQAYLRIDPGSPCIEPPTNVSKQASEEARWIRAVKTTYTDPLGVERTWESAERTITRSTHQA
ncbi:unnamed protein product [Penicillium salamii]|nr:unnamed protein product [Penicillium salamii]